MLLVTVCSESTRRQYAEDVGLESRSHNLKHQHLSNTVGCYTPDTQALSKDT